MLQLSGDCGCCALKVGVRPAPSVRAGLSACRDKELLTLLLYRPTSEGKDMRVHVRGNTDLPISERILQAQAVILVVAIFALVLATLFAERRESEARSPR
jgi:hypothetical protein